MFRFANGTKNFCQPNRDSLLLVFFKSFKLQTRISIKAYSLSLLFLLLLCFVTALSSASLHSCPSA